MKFINGLKKVCDCINKAVTYVTAALFIIILFACTVQVFTRYVLNSSATWTDETARYSFIWANLLGATVCSWTYGHAVLSFVVDRFPPKLRGIFRILGELIVCVISYVLISYSPYILRVAGIQRSPALHLPMNYVYIAVPVCGCLFMLYSIAHICEIVYNDFYKKEVLS